MRAVSNVNAGAVVGFGGVGDRPGRVDDVDNGGDRMEVERARI